MSMREFEQQPQNLMDSSFHQNFQSQPSRSSFQDQSQQNDEPIDFEKLIEAITQVQIAHNYEINIMVKALHSHPLTIPDVTNHSVGPKSYVVLKTKIHTPHQFKMKTNES